MNIEEENKYYVYALIDPRDDSIFYIGKGCGYRVRSHFEPSSLRKNTYKNNVIKEYRREGFLDQFRILEENLSEDKAYYLEVSTIKKLGKRIDNTGILTNLSNGGENPPKTVGKNHHMHDKVAKGTCPLQGENSTSKRLAALGEWSKIVQETQIRRVRDGSHHLLRTNNKRLKDKTHNFLGVKPWDCGAANQLSLFTWSNADKLSELYKEDPKIGYKRLSKIFMTTYGVVISIYAVKSIISYLSKGWSPYNDSSWCSFTQQFNGEI